MNRKPPHTPPDMEAPQKVIADRLSIDSEDDPNYEAEAPSSTIITQKPDWFKKALAEPFHKNHIQHEGCDVCYLEWGDNSKPGLVFLHGNGAHAHWYHFIAPQLIEDFHVISIHLSGMGDSGWRKQYSRELYADEVMAVCVDAQMQAKPIVIGHSFGGMVALITAHRHHENLSGIVLVDFTVKTKGKQEEWFADREAPRPTRVYASYEDARARFRLAPPQPCANQYILDYIGHHSLREIDNGWTWKFDPSIYYGFTIGNDHEEIYRNLPISVAGITGKDSWASDAENIEPMREMRPEAPLFSIPDANHHVLLDQPLAFVASLKALLCSWPK